MLGELRNLDTISSAITAAETGHLVFATLHTNDAPQTIDRIIDVFPTGQQRQIRSQLSAALSGILSQRLIPSNESGVVPAYELLINNAAVANLIRDERTHELRSVIETGMDQGMIDMDRSLAQLVKNNQVEESAAMRYAHNPAIFQRYLK
jgi:twitching motility protein PilT